jgi:LCP family protein required for cell wall assembly
MPLLVRPIFALLGVASALCAASFVHPRVPGSLNAAQAVARILVPPPQELFRKPNLRVLVVGLDYDYNARDLETSAHSRSDVIMAVNVDLAQRRVAELSVPRDMVATMPDGRVAKINQAQSDGGVGESQAVVSRWLGIPAFDRYVVLRIDTLKNLIDALGGVTVNVQNAASLRHLGANGPLDYDDNWGHLHVHLQPGVQHLDGNRAVGYARFRHDWCSDPCRIMRQQQVIHAVAQEVATNQLSTLLHVRELLGVLQRDVQTDLTPREELSLAIAFAHLKAADVSTAQVPFTTSVSLPGEGDAIVPDETEKRRLVGAMFGPSTAR